MATLGELEIDVVESDQINYQNTVTDKPVEDGADISDHIKQKPIEITLKCFFSGNETDKHNQLVEMRNAEEIFEYSGSLGTYENMAITEITPLKNATYGDGFECDINLKQVRIATLETTEVELELGEDPETGEQLQEDNDESNSRTSDEEEVDEESADQTTLEMLSNKLGL